MQFAAARAALTSSGGKKDQILAQQSLVLSLLDTLSAALKPLQKLEQLLAYEALRDDAHPTINSLSAVAADVSVALAVHGVSPLSATVGEYFDEERHSRFARGGVVPSDDLLDDLLVREVVRPGYVHTATGTVLVPVLVHASSATAGTPNAAAATSAPPVTETPRGTRVHEVASTDTLQGLCLRYNVQPQSLLRLNRLPNAQAIHARRTLRLPPLPSTAEPSSAAIREGGMEGGGGGAPVLVGGNGTHSSGGGGESGIPHATTSPSLAARIAARRQSRASRPLGGGGSWRSDDGGGATGGGSGEEEEEEEADPRLVAELESALNWSVEKLQQQQQITTSSKEGSSSIGKWRPDAELMEALGEAVRNALLQPWRAVASGSGEEEGTEGGERLYLRALALHASERTLRALLSRDGELLDAFASELWKAMRRLVEEGDEAILDVKRTSRRRPSKASGEERIYARDSFDLV